MTMQETALVRLLREEIRELELQHLAISEKLERRRRLLLEEMTGKPSPSPSSGASRIIGSIKEYLAKGPATFEQILAHLREQQTLGKVIIKGDPAANTRRSLGKSVSSGTISQDGELYRLP